MARFQQKKTEGSTKEAYALKTTDDFINKVQTSCYNMIAVSNNNAKQSS